MFSAGIWAFHFGYDNDAFPSMEKAAQLINNTGSVIIVSSWSNAICSQYTEIGLRLLRSFLNINVQYRPFVII